MVPTAVLSDLNEGRTSVAAYPPKKSMRTSSRMAACTRRPPTPESPSTQELDCKRPSAIDETEFFAGSLGSFSAVSDIDHSTYYHRKHPNAALHSTSNKIFQSEDNNFNDANVGCYNKTVIEKNLFTNKQPIGDNYKVVKATEWHRDKEEDYRMASKCRGICLIINNVTFETNLLPTRKGSDMDAFRFRKIFEQLGFEVESKRNLTAEKMKNCFKQKAALCMTKHDALVVILLSHGTESGIYGTDNIEVDLNDILTQFDNKSCKQMLGKPKVFIVQACRGRLADYGVRETQTFFSQPESQQQPSQLTQINSQSPMIARLPRWTEVDKEYCPTRTDMVLCFSSHTGYLSTRNEEDGSWLGASLALHLKLEAHRRHLLDILNMVSRDVRRRRSSDGHKQVLEITTIGFDKNLYFNPGLHEEAK